MKFNNFYESIIEVSAGKGGNGCLSFSKSKRKFKGKPDGGNGGNGGNIFIQSNKLIDNLIKLNHIKKIIANNGENGKKNNCNGKNGKNLYINVPINTKIYNVSTNELIGDLDYYNKLILVAKGGIKGLGNSFFKSSINRSPSLYTNGKNGDNRILKLFVELKPNIAILGFSNSGKSSLMNLISNSNCLINEKLFTTKNINLGIIKNEKYNKFLIMDTPCISNYNKNIFNLNYISYLKNCNLILYVINSLLCSKEFIIENINIILDKIYSNKFIKNKNIWIIFNKIDLIYNSCNFMNNINIIFSRFKKYKFYLVSCLNKFNINFLLKDIKNLINNDNFINLNKY